MDRMTIDTSDSPEIIITSINGTLRMKGWDRSQIQADMEHEDTLTADTDGNKVTIACTSGVLLRVPNDSKIKIDEIMNELVIKSVDGAIEVNNVHGQVMIKSIRAFSAKNVYGQFNAKHIEADLNCDRVHGQTFIQDVDGKITVKKALGNLSIRGYSTSLTADTAGNATLALEPELDGEYKVTASGAISCRLEPFANATVNMRTKAGKIKVSTPELNEILTEKEHQVVLGEGESQINLEATGNVELSQQKDRRIEADYDFDYDDLSDLSTLADDISQMVTDQIETQMDSISQHINDLTNNLSNIDVRTSERTRRKMEAQRRNLERKLASVERKAVHKARMAERRIEQRMRTRSPKPASDPVSDEERQKVLEMLQNQQISVAEAEVLLAALEGRTPEPAAETEQDENAAPAEDQSQAAEE